MRIAREAWPFVLPPMLLAVLAAAFGSLWAALVVALLAVFVLYFFRDPERSFEGAAGLVTAPADGVVTAVDTVADPTVATGSQRRIVTFLSAFNVHVQRCPTEGQVVAASYRPGRKVPAFRKDADQVNESHLTVLRRGDGDLVGIRQIAGLVARRVVPYLVEGRQVRRGDRLGIIKFGSRVDLLVPEDYQVLVRSGDRLIAGQTVVARPSDREPRPTEPNA